MLKIDPLSIVARRSYAQLLMNHGRIEEAHDLADGLLEQSSQAGYALHSSIAFWGEGRLTESLFWALQASPVAPSGPDVLALVGEYDEARRISSSHWIDVAERRWEAAIDVSRRNVELYPNSGIRLADAAEVLYHAGRLEEALPLYERANATAPKGRPIATFGPYFTVQLAVARRHAGDEEGAQAAAELAQQDHAMRRVDGEIGAVLTCTEAMIAAFDGDREHALAALELAIQRGLRWPMFFDDPVFEALRDDARFIRLRQIVEALVAEEHKKILQLICFNNPVPDDWQPMPETCAGLERQAEG